MRKSTLTILLLTLTFVGCLSPQMKQDLMDAGEKAGKKIAVAAATEAKTQAEALAKEWYDKGFAAGKAALEAQIKADTKIAPEERESLLAQLATAATASGVAAIATRYVVARGKAALAEQLARAKQALGIVVNSAEDLPPEQLAVLKQGVKASGGTHPAISSLIAEVKA